MESKSRPIPFLRRLFYELEPGRVCYENDHAESEVNLCKSGRCSNYDYSDTKNPAVLPQCFCKHETCEKRYKDLSWWHTKLLPFLRKNPLICGRAQAINRWQLMTVDGNFLVFVPVKGAHEALLNKADEILLYNAHKPEFWAEFESRGLSSEALRNQIVAVAGSLQLTLFSENVPSNTDPFEIQLSSGETIRVFS